MVRYFNIQNLNGSERPYSFEKLVAYCCYNEFTALMNQKFPLFLSQIITLHSINTHGYMDYTAIIDMWFQFD